MIAQARSLKMLRTAFGPALLDALSDPGVVEVMLNPDGRVWVDRLAGGLELTPHRLEPAEGERVIRLVAHHVGLEVDEGRPRISAELPGSGERFEGLLPPIVKGPAFAIRKPAVAVFTLDDYAAAGIMRADQAQALREAVAGRRNILVAGGTSSGKTTLVNALLAEMAGGDDRIILIEDTRELQCAAPNTVALRTRDGAVTLRGVVDETVRGLAGSRTCILAEVSGGLDSGIMATSLKANGFAGRTLWLNTCGPFAESDERHYAEVVVESFGDRLTIATRTWADLAEGMAFAHPRSLRPSLNRMDAVYDALQAELCDRENVDAILTGKGGDVAFFQTATSAILADQIRDQGLRALWGETAPVLARRLRRSAWRILRAGWAGARSPDRRASPRNGLLSADVYDAALSMHPWLRDLDRIGPAKRQQILGFASNLGLHSASERTRRADLLHPALSQPVMEAVLAIPAYRLTKGGHDRLMARDAFADRLPPALVQRRSKAELSGYYGRVLAANLDRLRPHLLEGRLAAQGLIDRDQVEAALRVEHLIWQGGYGELMLLALVESWLEAWSP